MKQGQRFSVLRTAALTVCAVLGCFLFAFGAVVCPFAGGGYSVNAETRADGAALVKLSKVEVSQNDDWIVTNDTKSLGADVLSEIFAVSVVYAEGKASTDAEGAETVEWTDGERTVLEFEGFTGSSARAITGETVEFAFNGRNINVSVTPKSGAVADPDDAAVTTVDAAAAYRSGTKRENGIYGEYIGTSALTTLSDIQEVASYIKVMYTYNDGTKQDISSAMGADNYNIDSSSLFPDKLNLLWSDGQEYTASVGITLKAGVNDSIADKSAAVLIDGVQYIKPAGFSSLGTPVTVAGQVARSKFDYTGFFVYADYADGTSFTVPLTAFENVEGCLSNEYFHSSNINFSLGNTLTTKANRVQVTFVDPFTKQAITSRKLAVAIAPISIDTPEFTYYEKEQNVADGKVALIEFNLGLTINVTLPDYSRYEKDGLPVINFAIDKTDNVEADNVNGKYKFSKPGMYKITATLDTAQSPDFVWGAPNRGGVRDDANVVLTYTAQIDKGKIVIAAGEITDLEYTYGQTPSLKPAITAKEAESDSVIADKFVLNEAFDGAVNDELYLYRMEYYGFDGFDKDNRSLTAPTEAGRYKAVAVTKENLYYESVLTDEINVTVVPKEIEVTAVLENPTYDRDKSYGNGDVLRSGVNAYDITVTGLETKAKYYKAEGYDIKLVIGNPNYYWKGNVLPEEWWADENAEAFAACRETDATFAVKQREIEYSVSGTTEFYYGDVDLSGIVGRVSAADEKYLDTPQIVYSAGAAADCNIWNKGSYNAVYTPRYAGGDADEEASLALAASAPFGFTVKPAEVTYIALGNGSAYYKPEGNMFDFNGWVSLVAGKGGLGSVADIQDLLTRTITGTRTDVKAPEYSADDPSKVALFDADVYTVTVSLPASGNFVWSGGGSGDITAVWTINKAKIEKVTAPESVTYNHEARTFSLVGDWNGAIMKKTVVGEKFGGGNISGFTDTPTSKDFALRAAGRYTIEVELIDKDNYEWIAADGNNSDNLILDFVISRAEVTLGAVSSEIDFDENKTVQALPKLAIVKKSDPEGILTDAELMLSYTIKDEDGNTVANNEIVKSGVYTFEFTGMTGSEADNYELKLDLTYTYKVKSLDLNIPTFDINTVIVYDGAEHDVTEYITNNAAENYGARIVITVKRGDTALESLRIRDVYGDELAYTVEIAPATSYSWKTGDGQAPSVDHVFTFNVTVKRLTADISWGKTEATYGDADGSFDPKPTISNLKADDIGKLSVTVGYKVSLGDADEIAAFSSTTAAGAYTVYAKAFGADDDAVTENNYKLVPSGAGASGNYSAAYTIKKQILTLPSVLEIISGKEYTGSEQSVVYAGITADAWHYLDGKITAATTRKNEKLGGLAAVADGVFDMATGTFAFTNAGVYTVVFEIVDKDNYCLNAAYQTDFAEADGSAYSDIRADFITVARKTVTPPALGNARAQAWGADYDASNLAIAADAVAGVTLTVKYGSGNAYDALRDDIPDGTDSGSIGQYFVKLSIDGENKLNYVWGKSSDPESQYVTIADHAVYTESDVAVFLQYAITGSQLVIDYAIRDYTFGDNGTVDGAIARQTLADEKADMVNDGSSAYTEAQKEVITFVDVKFFVGTYATNAELEGKTEMSGDELENGLPWNAGEYTVTFGVKFGAGNIYQTLPLIKNFTVNKRVIQIQWSDTSVVYNGGAQVATAEFIDNFVPVRASSGKISMPVLDVTIDGTDDKPINVKDGGYTLSVRSLSGDNKDNFTADGSTKTAFTVAPYDVAVKGVTVSAVYGDSLPDKAWEYVGANEFFDSAEHIKVYVTTAVDDISSAVEKPVYGTEYFVTVGWDDVDAQYAKNYNVAFGNAADITYSVARRQVTVTLVGGKIETEYYAQESGYKSSDGNYLTSLYSAVTDNGTGVAFVDDGVFALTSEVVRASDENAKGYAIFALQSNPNYAVTVNGIELVNGDKTDTLYKHIVTPAAIGSPNASGYADDYDGASHDIFMDLYAEVRNGQKVTWEYKKVGDTVWTVYTDGDGAVPKQIRNVDESASYNLRVSAPNHETYEFPAAITVKVDPVSLTVKIDLSIFYSEEDPAAAGYLAGDAATYIANAAYDVSDLRGADTRAVISGNILYTTTYVKGDPVSSENNVYITSTVVSGLASEHGNYTFVSAQGTLTVNKIAATIAIQDKTSAYDNENRPELELGVITVTSEQTYASSPAAIVVDDWNNVFALKSLALTPYKAGAHTARAGKYLIYAVAAESGLSENFDITFTGASVAPAMPADAYGVYTTVAYYTITDGELTGGEVSANNRTYNDLFADALTVSPVSASDGTAVDIKYYVYGGSDAITPDSVTVDDMTNGEWHDNGDAIPQFMNAATYYVFYSFTAENYAAKARCVAVTVAKKTDNAFDTEFAFGNGKQTLVTTDTADGAKIVWTYGRLDAAVNPDGYDGTAAGGQYATQPVASVRLNYVLGGNTDATDVNKIKITLSRYIGGAWTNIVTDSTDAVNDIMLAEFNNGTFGAGVYRLRFVLDGTSNYNGVTATYIFEVGKKALSITPDDTAADYGEDAVYTVTISGFADNGSGTEDLAIALGAHDASELVWDFGASDYSAGNNVGEYVIRVADKNNANAELFANYSLDCSATGTLTVNKRTVTVEIGDGANKYMLLGAYNNGEYAKEKINTLSPDGQRYTFEIVEAEGSYSSFHNGTVPFTLRTDAIVKLDADGNVSASGAELTNDAGAYAIYAVYTDETAKKNYNIKIANAKYSATVQGVGANAIKDGDRVGGVFTVSPAELRMDITGPYFEDASGSVSFGGKNYTAYAGSVYASDAGIYDGKAKHYTATPLFGNTRTDIPESKKPLEYTPVYAQKSVSGSTTSWNGIDGAPTDAGSYRVLFRPAGNNANYIQNESSAQTIEIAKRTVTYGVVDNTNTSVTYNGAEQSVVFGFNGVIDKDKASIVLDTVVTYKEHDGKTHGKIDGVYDKADKSAYKYVENNTVKVKVTAVDALVYDITVKLGDDEHNYTLNQDGAPVDKIRLAFTVNLKELHIFVQDSEVQYGTPVFDGGKPVDANDRFDGFRTEYGETGSRVTSTAAALKAMIDKNKTDGNFTTDADFGYAVAGYSVNHGVTSAENRLDIAIGTIAAANFDITGRIYGGKLNIAQRKIDVALNGAGENNTDATREYDGSTNYNTYLAAALAANIAGSSSSAVKFIVPSVDWNGKSGDALTALGIVLTVNPSGVGQTVRNAGDYYITATWNNANYTVTFKYKNNDVDLSAGNAPVYRITKATLYVKVQDSSSTAFDTATGTGKPTVVDTVYGTDATAVIGTLAVRFSGWKASDGTPTSSQLLSGYTVTYTVALNGDAYAAYKAHVGQKYVITGRYGETVTLVNYDIVYVDGELNITPLVIGVSTEDREYVKADDGYHGGKYGMTLEAEITPDGGDTGEYKPKFLLEYNTAASSEYNQAKGRAPNRVGDYTVKVSVDAYAQGLARDYAFGRNGGEYVYDTTLAYSITKQSIELAWDKKTIAQDAENRDNAVNYISDIMSFVSLSHNDRPFNDYTITEGVALEIENAPAGAYVLTVNFTADAYHNYNWVGFDGTQATAIFVVSSDGLVYITDFAMTGDDLTLGGDGMTAVGWVYGNTSAGFAAKLIDSDGAEVSGAEVTFEYGAYVGAATEGGHDNLTDVGGVSFKLIMPADAGLYVARASYAGDRNHNAADNRYYVFRITKKSIAKPTLELSDVYAENNGAINISRELEGFDGSAMRIVNSAVNYTVSDDTVTLNTLLANPSGYSVTVGLVNGNYEWADGGAANVTVTWKVAQGENEISWKPGEIDNADYGKKYELTAYNKFTVNGTINYWYSPRTEGQTEDDAALIPVENWTSGFPVNAGEYWIRAVGSSANGNYTTARGHMAFTVNKVDLAIMPSGSLTYGTTFDDAKRGFTFAIDESMLKNDDLAEVIKREISSSLALAGNGYETVIHTGVLSAGSYQLTLKAATRNYNIVNKNTEKALTVNKKTLEARIGGVSSQYGKSEIANKYKTARIDLSGLAAADLADEAAIIATVREKLMCDATVTSNVGGYDIYLGEWTHPNYTLDVTRGVYTITKLPVIVAFDNGGGEYGSSSIVYPSVKSITDEAGNVLTDAVKGFITVEYVGLVGVPTATGRHSFVGMLADDCNYMLARSAGGTFVISQRELDASLIVWEDVYYDGEVKAPKPVNTDVFDNVNFDTDITISYKGEWINAGVAYIIELKLNSTVNTKWKTVDGDTREIVYTVKRGQNSLKPSEEGGEPTITIKDWTYGGYGDDNAPKASTAFGSDNIRYEYSTTKTFEDGTVLNGLPENAGTYYVRAVVSESANWEYFESEPVEFKVLPVMQAFPVLGVYSETGGGNYKNDTYTGEQLAFEVEGFDSTDMEIAYDGVMITRGNRITLLATNAGTYSVTITLKNGVNYNWAKLASAHNSDGSARNVVYDPKGSVLTITWTIAKKKLALPTANDNTYIVNGSELVYIPVGFDETTMTVTGNKSGYGGSFTAYVSIIDTDNYEWADGTLGAVAIEWRVVGADALFAALASVFAVLAAGAAAFMCVELYRYLKKKKAKSGGFHGGGGSNSRNDSAAEASKTEKSENAETTEKAEAARVDNAPAAENNNEGKVTA